VQSFVNTWEAETGVDLLGDEPSARRWFEDAGLVTGAETAGTDLMDLGTVREAREAIRTLLVANAEGADPSESDLRALRRIAASTLHLVLDEAGRVDVQPDNGDEAWASRLLLIMRDAQHDGTWKRLKACRNPDCEWAFYDRSHAGRGAWCDMAVCGNRIKNRNLRSRRAAAGLVGGSGDAR
jgi:predicted RNA-binding Zn ribbon-like protein